MLIKGRMQVGGIGFRGVTEGREVEFPKDLDVTYIPRYAKDGTNSAKEGTLQYSLTVWSPRNTKWIWHMWKC